MTNSANVNLCKDEKAYPLHAACQYENDAYINAGMNDGAGPFNLPCQGHGKVIQHLLRNGADIVLCKNDKSQSSFFSLSKKHDSTVHFYIKIARISICV